MARITTDGSITDKQEQFCQEYITDKNGKRAYLRVYKVNNEKTAEVCACKLLRKAKIKNRIARIQADLAVKLEVTREGQYAKYQAVVDKGMDKDDLNAVNAAITGQNKLFGLSIDKTVTESTEQAKELKEAEVAAAKDYARFKLRRQA